MKTLRQQGQGITEYIIIVALVAVAGIAAFKYFGQTVRAQTAGIAMEVSGQSAKSAIEAAKGAAGNAKSEASKEKGLDAYSSDAAQTGSTKSD